MVPGSSFQEQSTETALIVQTGERGPKKATQAGGSIVEEVRVGLLTHNSNCAVDYDDEPIQGPLDSTWLLGDVPQDAGQQEVNWGESDGSTKSHKVPCTQKEEVGPQLLVLLLEMLVNY